MKCHNFRVFRHQIAIWFLFIDIIVSFCIVFVFTLQKKKKKNSTVTNLETYDYADICSKFMYNVLL